MRRLRGLILALLAAAPAAPAAASPPATRGCGSAPYEQICLQVSAGEPARLRSVFPRAARQTVDALYSQALMQELAQFQQTHGQRPELAGVWRPLDVAATLAKAYDGAGAGPILLNRYRLDRSAPSLANTFAHEAAHRAGLSHPSSTSDFTRALCEPPYVIGSLVEKAATGAGWRPGPNDCALLAAAGAAQP